MRTIVDSPLKMSRKYSTSSSGSNWMLGVIPARIENNLQEIIMSPFEPTHFPYWNSPYGSGQMTAKKSTLENEQNYRRVHT